MLIMRGKVVVKPEAREAFLQAVGALALASRKNEGVVSYDVCESVTEPNTFVSIEVYDNEEAAKANEQSEAWRHAVQVIQNSLAEPPSGEVYVVAAARPMQMGDDE